MAPAFYIIINKRGNMGLFRVRSTYIEKVSEQNMVHKLRGLEFHDIEVLEVFIETNKVVIMVRY